MADGPAAPSAVTAPMAPGTPPLAPGQPVQILLPPQLQGVMEQFPDVLKRVSALEGRTGAGGPPTKLVAAFFFLCGLSLMAFLVFLYHYGSVFFRL